jgi:hypothetical protein
VRARLSHGLRWLEANVVTRRGALAVFALALAVFAIQSVAVSLYPGRDIGTYLRYYVEIWKVGTVFPAAMLQRTPVAPLAIGIPLDLGGGWLLEILMGVLFAASIVAWRTVALSFGPRATLLVTAALLVYPGYGILFHGPSSDPIFAAAFAGWAVLVTRAALRPTLGRFAAVGLGVALLALIRPGNQVLIAFFLFPLFLRTSWRRRLAWAGVTLAAAAIPLIAWSGYNRVRYDDFTVARAGAYTFFRAFVTDRIVSPENGPASRELAAAVQRELLPNEPYRSYGITLQDFFSSGSVRMHDDLVWLSDRVWGWDSDYRKLRDASLEAIRRHPGTYTRGVGRTTWQQLWWPLYHVPPGGSNPTVGGAPGPGPAPATIAINGRQLPRPTEGEPIPSSYQGFSISTPDNRIHDVWTSPTEHHLVYDNPHDARRARELGRDFNRLVGRFHTHNANPALARRLNQASRWYPRPILWLLIGLAAAAFRRPSRIGIALALALPALAVIFFTALGFYAVVEYAVPVAPAFVVLGAAGLFGRRAEEVGSIGSAAP